MIPQPTGLAPRLVPLPGIRAVLLDIYGTLLVSSSGEIHPDPRLRAAIELAHASSPHPFPEVDIREIHASLHPELAAAEIETLAMEHERRSNPVAAMPAAVDTLRLLGGTGIELGLISNAQFYTVPILEACLGVSLTELRIDPSLCRFSYREKRAKPDPVLFTTVREVLAMREISAAAVLYVGNDVRNDIEPARSAGFRTALFAGDMRSLRLRDKSLADCGADVILTELQQLPSLLATGC